MLRPRSSFASTCDIASTLIQSHDARREIDDATTVPHPLRGFPERVERTFQVDRDVAIEECVVRVGELRELHDAGRVDQRVDAAVGLLCGIEQLVHRARIADIGGDGNCLPSLRADARDQFLGGLRVARKVDDDLHSVARESRRDSCADSA
jgi:rRNA-processing protein FCF1